MNSGEATFCMSLPKVSVVIINAKGIKLLNDCLKYLLRTNYPNFEVIVVDCLTDGIEEFIKNNYPSVKVVHFEHDIGASESHNLGVKFSDPQSKYVAFLDNDTKVDPEWLSELIRVLERDESIGAAQSMLLLADQTDKIDGAGDFVDIYGRPQRPRGRLQPYYNQFSTIENIFSPRGAAMIVRKDVYDKVGGFDRDFFIFYDDVDFGWRVWLAGFRVVLIPKSKVYHWSGATTKASHFAEFHLFKNKYSMIIKNFETKNLRFLILNALIDSFSAIYRILYFRDVLVLIARFKAALWILKNLRHLWNKHIYIQYKVRRVSDSFIRKQIMVKPKIYFPLQK